MLLGASFAGANVWFAAARSTIPLELHGNVTQKQRLIEKTPGIDDVYLVTFDSIRRIQVDRPVFDSLVPNRSVNKPAWSRTLDSDGRMVNIDWSADFRGMVWAMPLIAVMLVVCGILTILASSANADEPADALESPIQSK